MKATKVWALSGFFRSIRLTNFTTKETEKTLQEFLKYRIAGKQAAQPAEDNSQMDRQRSTEFDRAGKVPQFNRASSDNGDAASPSGFEVKRAAQSAPRVEKAKQKAASFGREGQDIQGLRAQSAPLGKPDSARRVNAPAPAALASSEAGLNGQQAFDNSADQVSEQPAAGQPRKLLSKAASFASKQQAPMATQPLGAAQPVSIQQNAQSGSFQRFKLAASKDADDGKEGEKKGNALSNFFRGLSDSHKQMRERARTKQ